MFVLATVQIILCIIIHQITTKTKNCSPRLTLGCNIYKMSKNSKTCPLQQSTSNVMSLNILFCPSLTISSLSEYFNGFILFYNLPSLASELPDLLVPGKWASRIVEPCVAVSVFLFFPLLLLKLYSWKHSLFWPKLPWGCLCPLIDLQKDLNISGMLSDGVKGLLVMFPQQRQTPTPTIVPLQAESHQHQLEQPTCWVTAVYIEPLWHAATRCVAVCMCRLLESVCDQSGPS